MPKLLLSFVACVLVAFSGCSKSETPDPAETQTNAAAPSPPNPPEQPTISACALLTSQEIESLQGEPLQEGKATAQSNKSLTVSQCFFALPTFTKSISLQVVQKGNMAGVRDPKQVWGEMFASEKLQVFETEGGKKKLPPRRIPDLGEEAFWAGGPAGGLYVLQSGQYIFISVGGGDDEETRIKKSTTFAQLVLKRLHLLPPVPAGAEAK